MTPDTGEGWAPNPAVPPLAESVDLGELLALLTAGEAAVAAPEPLPSPRRSLLDRVLRRAPAGGNYHVIDQISELKRWVGFHEGGNNVQPFTAWQFDGANRNLAWCGSFADYCSCQSGQFRFDDRAQCGWKGSAYVPDAHTTAIRMRIWRSKNTHARQGWQVIYSWTGAQDDHIETIITDTGGRFITIGGNTGDMVAYRMRDRANVVGFIALDEAGQNAGGAPGTGGGTDVKPIDRVDACGAPHGVYVLGADGGIFGYGGAPYYGSVPGLKIRLVMNVNHATSLLLAPDAKGYWILGVHGGIFGFGSAAYKGNFRTQVAEAYGNGALELLADGHGGYLAVRALDGALLHPTK